MSKRNKVRYQSKQKPRVAIVLTGKVYLRLRDEELIAQAAKGDVMAFAKTESVQIVREEDYECTGFAGYFKIDVHDGYRWQPLLLNDVFSERQHHFSKRERPIDTYAVCEGILRGMAKKILLRTYREHYAVEE